MSEAEFEALMAKRSSSCPLGGVAHDRAVKTEPAALTVEKEKKSKGPNKTEQEYGRHLSMEFPGAKVRFEPITLHLDNTHSYTPDFGVFLITGEIILVEVKARGKTGYRHPSYQRARCMFDQSRLDYPMWKWRWAEKQSGKWYVTNY